MGYYWDFNGILYDGIHYLVVHLAKWLRAPPSYCWTLPPNQLGEASSSTPVTKKNLVGQRMAFYGGLIGSNGNFNGIWLVVSTNPSEK